jgi:N-acyl-L-homoserine lactone synthetase
VEPRRCTPNRKDLGNSRLYIAPRAFTIAAMVHTAVFHARAIDDDPRLLEQSYRLRYQVYCVERQFLDAAAYPDGREADEFDSDSIHLGVVDADGDLAGTARLIRANPRGFPMLRHCAFYPEVQMLEAPHVVPVEVSRVAISRHCARARQRTEPFLTLVRAMVHGARYAGATHLIGATDAALHRWLVHFGLPYRVSGPPVDYYGQVSPCIMSLRELDEVVADGRFPSLQGLDAVWTPALSQAHEESGLVVS